jgi:stage V sporulation protein B
VSRKESLVRGAAALAVAGLVIKVSNLLVRIPLTRLIDSEGLGIYQIALPAFFALYHLAAGGVPVAVQNLVAEYMAKGRRTVAEQVLRMALTYTTLAGGAAMLLLVAGAPLLARALGEARANWALMALAPAVPLFALDSIYRNYLQGRKLMTPSAVGSVLEQGTKVAVTMLAAYLLIPQGKEMGAAGAAMGITAGAVISMIYMVYMYRAIRAEDEPDRGRLESRGWLARRMISLAWPVTVGSVTIPLLTLVDVGIVQRGFLRAGYPQRMATAMYGAYSGIAVQVIWFPFVLTNALANALVPVLTAAKARGDMETVRERVLLGLRATGLICLPVTFGVALLAGPIARLFGEQMAARPLMYMAPVAYLGPLSWLMTAQLQGLGRTGIPMRNHIMAMGVKIGLDTLLAPIRGIDVMGVALASVAMFSTSCWLNARALEAEMDEPLPWGWLLRGPLLASVVMGGALFGLAAGGVMPVANLASVSVTLAVAPMLYVGTLVLSRALTWEEVKALGGPVAVKLERWFQTLFTWT